MGLNVWVLILLAIALSGAVGYIAGQSRVRRDFSERIRGLRRAYEERLKALDSGASGSRLPLPRTRTRRLGPAWHTTASAPKTQSPA
jgi:hypothetical protein